MYHPDGSRYGPFATSDPAHVPQYAENPSLQMTVNPTNLLFSVAEPSHGSIHPYGVPHNVAPADCNIVGYPAVPSMPQGATQSYPVWSSQYMGDPSVQPSVINDVPMGHSTTPVRLLSRGISTCQWVLGDGTDCGQTITRGTVPKHLADHGVQRMHRKRKVRCGWRGCQKYMKRQGLPRHYREVHLGLKRKCHKACSPRTIPVTHKL